MDALVLIDLQNDYFPGGSMQLAGTDEAAGRAAGLLAEFRARKLPVFHVQHLSVRPGATFFVPGTLGVEINRAVSPAAGEPVVTKNFPNAFRQTDLEKRLRDAGVDRVIFCGAMSHMCVDATVRAACDLGFRCVVAHDACATRDLAFQGRTIDAASVHGAFMAALAVPYAQIVAAAEVPALLGA